MLSTLSDLKNTGYNKDICLVIGNDLLNSDKLKTNLLEGVFIKHFKDIDFSNGFLNSFYTMEREDYWRSKIFQYHKLHLFNTFFKKWDYIFYIDSGVKIYSSIDPILDSVKEYKLLAHSDAYHTYEWKLNTQFSRTDPYFQILSENYDLDIDYPQTTIMLYDTLLIDDNTYSDLLSLSEEIKISRTNDQGIIALYFTNIKKVWEQIRIENEERFFYDYLLRPHKIKKPHIMLKRAD
jgi:hypothetical protein